MNTANLETTLKQLRLSGLCQTLGVRLQEAAANRLGHAEFLELILQDELNVRQERLMERRTKAADFHTSEWPVLNRSSLAGFDPLGDNDKSDCCACEIAKGGPRKGGACRPPSGAPCRIPMP